MARNDVAAEKAMKSGLSTYDNSLTCQIEFGSRRRQLSPFLTVLYGRQPHTKNRMCGYCGFGGPSKVRSVPYGKGTVCSCPPGTLTSAMG